MKNQIETAKTERISWNKGLIVGPKRALRPKEIWAIRTRLEIAGKLRDIAMFNLALDSKLRGCDLMSLKMTDVWSAGQIRTRTTIVQRKTKRPVQFELTQCTREALQVWIEHAALLPSGPLFPSRLRKSAHLSTRVYARCVDEWVAMIGLNPAHYGTHSMRRTKAALIYKSTGNLRAVQLLLGHTKLESTVRYLGIEVDDALHISEQVDL
jgi:integrase